MFVLTWFWRVFDRLWLIHPVFPIYLKTPKSIPCTHVHLIFLPPFTAINISSYSLSTNWQWKPLCLAWIIFCFCLVANCWVQDWKVKGLQRKSESARWVLTPLQMGGAFHSFTLPWLWNWVSPGWPFLSQNWAGSRREKRMGEWRWIVVSWL